MKKNKLLISIILIGFLTFGMSYNNTIEKNFVAPLIRQVTEFEQKITAEVSPGKIKTSPVAEKISVNSKLVAATISVTNAVTVNGGGNAAPGSLLDFTVTVSNIGTDDATGTTFQDILDANLTLVPNSFKVTPIAVNDTYNSIGNVGITVNAAQGVLANDVSPDGTSVTVAILAGPTHGTATLSANGSFIYNPTAGYFGADSFTYTLKNAAGKTSVAAVNIIVSTPIYFVNSSAATNGNGTLQNPFKLVQNVTGTGSNPIFIYTEIAPNTNSGTILTLSANQKVIGQGATSSLASILSLTVPSYSNILPATGGTNPTFAGISLQANNDIQAVILSSNITGTSVGNLKVRNVSISGGSAIAVNINGGGILDCIFQSVSANGASEGIVIKNATGGFLITGTGTTAGSGGTIQNITNTGANFNNCTNISLKNMNFVNCGSTLPDSNGGGIYAVNVYGNSSITNTNVTNSGGHGFYGYNDIQTSSLTVTGCKFIDSFNKANGANSFTFEGYGTSNNTLVLKGNDFSNPKIFGLTLNFGNTSTNTIQVGGGTLAEGNVINAAVSTPGSNGLSLQSNGSSIVNYNIINNSIKSSFNGSFTCNVGSQDNATMNGRINLNTITGGGASSVANGISVAAYRNSKHITEIVNNTITNANNYGILSEANHNGSTTANARMDATIKNNNISLVAASYAHVGVIAIGSVTSSLISAANIVGNTTNNPVSGLIATFDVRTDGTGTQVILQGTTALANGTGDRSVALANFWNANNPGGTRTAIDEMGIMANKGTIVSGTVLIPGNPSASKFAPTSKIEEESVTDNQNSTENKPSTSKSTAKTASGETISVGPFTLPAGKSTVITFSAIINAAASLPVNTCAVTNQATVSGTNFTTVNSNITTTSIKPGNATFTNSTQNISCLGSTPVTLNAACPLGTTATWYTALTGGTSFATGSSVTATPTANNTTYCVACEVAYCASDRLLVKTVTGTPSTTSAPETIAVCDSYTWPVNSATYTTSGTYTAVVGCDTKTLNLTITTSTTSAPETVTACGSYTWAVNGSTYTSSGTKTAIVGCDTKTLNLTITPSTASAPQTIAACDSYTWAVNGVTYSSSGSKTAVVGCDTKTLNLTITPSTSANEIVTACDSYKWPVNGTTYTTSGTYSNVVGCDTKTLDLTITNSSAIIKTVALNSGILSSNQSGAAYQWYKCPNTLIFGETNQTYTPPTTGDYKVDITVADCTVTSDCVIVSTLAVGEFEQNEFKIYPNPSKGTVNIITPYEGNYIIIDVLGRTIKSFELHENIVNTLNLENVSEGTYFIKNTSNKINTQKLIIKK